MLIIGVSAFLCAATYAPGSLENMGPGFFPMVAAGLLCAVAVFPLVRAALRRSPPVRRSRPLYIGIVVAGIVLFVFAIWTWGYALFPYFGPAEFFSVITLELATAILLAHTSRSRAAGMVLLGLLLSATGLDPVTGVVRFNMGIEALSNGIDKSV